MIDFSTFVSEKNLTSDGSKPIRVLINPNLSDSDLRLPISYSLPDFQVHISNFYLQPTAAAAAAAAMTRQEGGRQKKK